MSWSRLPAWSGASRGGSTNSLTHRLTNPRFLCKSPSRTLLCLLNLLFTVARRGVRLERVDEASGRGGDFRNSLVERRLVGARWAGRAAQLAHELERRGVDFVVGRRRCEVRQR